MSIVPVWDTSCLDWADRIRKGQSLIPFEPLFPDEAQAALDVYKSLHVVDVAGAPTLGDCSRPWSFDIPKTLFGSYNPDTARRLIREYFLLVSKKNAKSSTAAGIMLTALIRNWRRSAEFLIVAPTLEVANNSFFPARDMVKEDPELRELLHIREHLKIIEHKTTGAVLKVIAADNNTVSGKKATGVLIEELWLFGKQSSAENMLREATGGLVSRPEGFTIYISTHSDEPPAGVFKQKLNYFRDVRDGKINDKRSLPVLYEYPEEMLKAKDYLKQEYWSITNPNLGLSVDEEYIEDKLKEAQNAGPQSLNVFLAKHLNVEIGQSLRNDRWPGADEWEVSGDKSITAEEIIRRCEVVTAGVDGGGLDDLFSADVTGRDKDTGEWLTLTKSWCHKSVLHKRKSEASKFLDFEKDGDLKIIDVLGEDIDQCVEFIMQFERAGLLSKIGMDPFGVGGVIDAFVDAGIDIERIVSVPQGYQLQGAIKTAERKLADRTLKHAAQPIMAYAVGNARIEQKGNAVLITKQASGTAKIDPLMAMFDSIALMSQNPESMSSVYTADRGIPAFG